MSEESPGKKFHYHAYAHVLSGRFTRPVLHDLAVQAATSLPTTGGVGSSRVENFRFDESVSFKAGYSHVTGSEKVKDGQIFHTTMSTAAVEGLNILDVVTADRIVARLTSSHGPDDNGDSQILLLGSRFENLRIAGCKVEVEFHHELALKLERFRNVQSEFENNDNFRKMAQNPFGGAELPKKLEHHGSLHCSLVKEIHPERCPGVIRHGHHGHVLEVPEFGKIFLLETLFEFGRKTLTMLRVELGSPNGGGVTAVEAGTNGRPPSGP